MIIRYTVSNMMHDTSGVEVVHGAATATTRRHSSPRKSRASSRTEGLTGRFVGDGGRIKRSLARSSSHLFEKLSRDESSDHENKYIPVYQVRKTCHTKVARPLVYMGGQP